MTRSAPAIRRANVDDIAAIVTVAAAALGWDPREPNAAFFRWKHLDNPAGVSPMWVATDRDEIIGFRSMLAWRFHDGEKPINAVRAVDTATHPDHQRRGIFRALTTQAVDDLITDGADFVFNTPNAASRNGYLTMGWEDHGRLPAVIRLGGIAALPRVLRARMAADKWSMPLTVGDPIGAIDADLGALTAAVPDPIGRLVTQRTTEHLRWRYGHEPLHYRAVRSDDGVAIVRLRRRGPATEAVLAELFAPDRPAARKLIRMVAAIPSVDHVLSLASGAHPAPWRPAVPGLGPRLTTRALTSDAPPGDAFAFSLGDIELF